MKQQFAWRQRNITSSVLRAVVVMLPPVAAIAAGLGAGRVLPKASGAGAVVWWAAVFAVSMAALYGTERAARRLLSLSMLLRLSLMFPDQAPSRLAIALRSGSMRRLRKWAAAVDGPSSDLGCNLERVLTLVTALNTHDRRTRGHSERVRALTDMMAEELAIEGEDADRLRWASLLHDVGKLSVPAAILNKTGKPDDREWTILRRHPAEGERIAAGLRDWLGDWVAAIHGHHERWDGTGYPAGLRSEDIPLGARIVAVTDAFETMTALRAYKKPMSADAARAELTRCAGTHFGPRRCPRVPDDLSPAPSPGGRPRGVDRAGPGARDDAARRRPDDARWLHHGLGQPADPRSQRSRVRLCRRHFDPARGRRAQTDRLGDRCR